MKDKTNRTPSDPVRAVNIVWGGRGDQELRLFGMQGFDFIVHLLSLLVLKIHIVERSTVPAEGHVSMGCVVQMHTTDAGVASRISIIPIEKKYHD